MVGAVRGALALILAVILIARVGFAEEADATRPGTLGAAALWERFTTHLRRGEMREAWLCFSPRSREAFPFNAFAAHYHPLTAASEATLSPVDNGQFRVNGELAEMRFLAAPVLAGNGDGEGRGVFVNALLVYEEGAWYLVAAACEAETRIEATVRNLLRALIVSRAVQDRLTSGVALDNQALLALVPEIQGAPQTWQCLRHYRLTTRPAGNSQELLATPKIPVRGLCAYAMDAQGRLRVDGLFRAPPINKEIVAPKVAEVPKLPPDLGDPAEMLPERKPVREVSSRPSQLLDNPDLPRNFLPTPDEDIAAMAPAQPPLTVAPIPPPSEGIRIAPLGPTPDLGDPEAAPNPETPAVPSGAEVPLDEEPLAPRRSLLERPGPELNLPSLPALPALSTEEGGR